MMIGKRGKAVTSICTADAATITVRGRNLSTELIGNVGFSEFFFLLVAGHMPTPNQRFFLDSLLVSIAEHGLTPSVVASRMTLAADPDNLQGAVAAGILGCGSVVLGTAEYCSRLLLEAGRRADQGEEPESVARALIEGIRARKEFVPGFGHPLHHPVDPRAERILQLADDRGITGRHVTMARHLRIAVERVWGRPMPMNVSMPIAAVMLDLDFPRGVVKGIPILARTAGILAHLAEEKSTPIGFLMAFHADEAIRYVPPEEDRDA